MMKKVSIGITVVVCGFFLLMIVGMMLHEGGTKSEQIERECRRSYGTQGEAAVLDCQLAMTVRYLKDADQSKADSTYNRIR